MCEYASDAVIMAFGWVEGTPGEIRFPAIRSETMRCQC